MTLTSIITTKGRIECKCNIIEYGTKRVQDKTPGGGIKKQRLLSWLLAMGRIWDRQKLGNEEVVISRKGLQRQKKMEVCSEYLRKRKLVDEKA